MLRAKSMLFSILIIIMVLLGTSLPASGKIFRAGYTEASYTGIRADISTPPYLLHIEPCHVSWFIIDCFQYHFVSTLAPFWMQAGWGFSPNTEFSGSIPKNFYEFCALGCCPGCDPSLYQLIWVADQPWGTTIQFEVSSDINQGIDVWCAWVGGDPKACRNTQNSPTTLIAQSEIHTLPCTQIFTIFDHIRVRDINNNWLDPNLDDNISAEPPYNTTKLDYESFLTSGMGSHTYLPFISR